MKKIFILGVALFSFVADNFAQTTYTWTGGTSSFTTATNWSPNGTPGSVDDVVFDGTSSANCSFDADISINSISITSAYTGTINALATLPTINSNFSQAGGTFISTSANMDVLGNISFTGGTFQHNSGDVTVYVGIGSTWSISGALTFNNLNISTTAGNTGTERIVSFGGGCLVNNLFLVGSTRLYSYQGNVNILSSLTVSGSNTGNPTSNTGSFTFSGAGPITITGASAVARNKLPNLVFNTSGNYSMSSQINVQGNWTGTQGTLVIGTSSVNLYGSSATIGGATSAFDNLVTQTGASVTFPSSAEVFIGKSVNFSSGSVTFPSTSTLSFNGTTAQGITGSFTAGSIHVYTGGGRTVTLNSAVTLIDALIVDASTTFAAGSNLTLRANSSGTARIAQSAGTITGSGIKVETFIPGNFTGWTNMGVRGVYGQSVSSWDTYVSSSAANGIPMTCTGCAYSPTVVGTGSSSFVSIQDWNEAADSYVELVSSDPLSPGKGHWVYVGDGQTNTSDLTTINTGSLVQGNISVTMSSAGSGSFVSGFGTMYYNLVANPYPSPISATSLFGGTNVFNFSGAIYVWNPDLSSGAGGYASFSGGVSTPGGAGAQTDVIPGGQGFYVEYQNVISNTLDFDESMKTSQSAPLLKTTDIGKLVRLKIAGQNDQDETVFRIHPDATIGYDKRLDANKIFQSPGYAGYPGSYSKYTTLSSKDGLGNNYSIHSLPPLTQSVSVPLLARVSASGTYTISAFDFQNFNMCLGIVDKLTNTYHDLRQSPYSFTIADTTSSPRFELVMCKDESLNETGVAENTNAWSNVIISQDQQGAFVKTAFDKNTKAIISVYNLLGQKLMEDIQTEGTVNSTNLNLNLHNQVVLIRVSTDKQSTTKKLLLN